MRDVLERSTRTQVMSLAALFGVWVFLSRAQEQSWGEALDVRWILLLSISAGPLLGLFELYVISALLKWTGGWLGGEAPIDHVRAAVAFGRIPLLWLSLLWIVPLVVLGSDAFTAVERTRVSPPVVLPLGTILTISAVPLLFTIALALLVWIVITAVTCLAEAQGFSAWRALVNHLLAYAFMVLGGILIAVSVAVLYALVTVS
jgi:hypothetical protein